MSFVDDCANMRAAFSRGKEPFDAVESLIDDFYGMPDNGVGGVLHIVLDDSNLEDDSIDWCVKQAREQNDGNAVALGELLREMTLKQRLQVPNLICPCGCTNELREQVGLPLVEPSVVMESFPGGVTIRPTREMSEPPPEGGWQRLVPEPGAIKGWRKP